MLAEAYLHVHAKGKGFFRGLGALLRDLTIHGRCEASIMRRRSDDGQGVDLHEHP